MHSRLLALMLTLNLTSVQKASSVDPSKLWDSIQLLKDDLLVIPYEIEELVAIPEENLHGRSVASKRVMELIEQTSRQSGILRRQLSQVSDVFFYSHYDDLVQVRSFLSSLVNICHCFAAKTRELSEVYRESPSRTAEILEEGYRHTADVLDQKIPAMERLLHILANKTKPAFSFDAEQLQSAEQLQQTCPTFYGISENGRAGP